MIVLEERGISNGLQQEEYSVARLRQGYSGIRLRNRNGWTFWDQILKQKEHYRSRLKGKGQSRITEMGRRW